MKHQIEYIIEYRNTAGEWANIETLGQDMTVGLENLEDAVKTFHEIVDVFDDDADYRLIELHDDGFEMELERIERG